MRDLRGIIFDIQRFSIHDGPGIRTTVFMKGCPLRCVWCHNPESQSAAPLLSFARNLCIGCGACAAACPAGAIRSGDDGRAELDRTKCVGCFACADACPARALERTGRMATVAEVMAEVAADKPFYNTSGGGMTLSGGEPLAQAAFGRALLDSARAEDIATAVETSLYAPWETPAAWLPLVDRWLCDWKETDPDRHREWTGVDNALIRENLFRLDAAGAEIELRCPLVPGANLWRDHLEGIARLSNELGHCRGVTVMAYHRLGEGKRERFAPLPEQRAFTPDDEAIARALATLEALGARQPQLG